MEIISAKKISRNKDWRVIIYGKPGIGKTSSVRFLKGKTLVWSLDNSQKVLSGLDNVDVINFDRVHPSQEVNDFLRESSNFAKNYDNIVIDNISSFEKDWFVEKGRQSKNGISNEIQDYSQWTNYFARVMTQIYLLQNVNILVTAWEKQVPITTASGQQFNQYAPEIRDAVRDGLLGLTDVVGRVVLNPDTGKRGVILEGNDGVFAKNRLDNRTATPIEQLFNFNKKVSDK